MTFKVCDSFNSYCCVLDIYVGETDDGTKASKFGKTHDLIVKLLSSYLNKGYVIPMDKFYSSPYLFYNLLSRKTHACGPVHPRKGLPQEIASAKFKVQVGSITMNYDDKIVAHHTNDRKHITPLSTAYSAQPVLSIKLHWQTKEPIERPKIIHMYNKYMGGVDCNDQLMKYAEFSHRTCKWWKKVLFRLLNLAMANVYITYSEWVALKENKKLSQTNFRTEVIKQMIKSTALDLTRPTPGRPSNSGLEIQCLTGHHFPTKKREALRIE